MRALAIYLMDRQHLPLQRCAELLGELPDGGRSVGGDPHRPRRGRPLLAELCGYGIVEDDETGEDVLVPLTTAS